MFVLASLAGGCQELPTLEGTRCNAERPCGDGMRCLGNRCSRLTVDPSFCETDSDCQAGPVPRFCYSTVPDEVGRPETYVDNFCVNCFEDTHCPSNAVCLLQPGGLTCIGCYGHTHCETGLCQNNICRSCNPANPANAGCPDGTSCTDGRCVGCATDAECDSNRCADGVCRICVDDGDCCPDGVSCARACVDRRCEDK